MSQLPESESQKKLPESVAEVAGGADVAGGANQLVRQKSVYMTGWKDGELFYQRVGELPRNLSVTHGTSHEPLTCLEGQPLDNVK